MGTSTVFSVSDCVCKPPAESRADLQHDAGLRKYASCIEVGCHTLDGHFTSRRVRRTHRRALVAGPFDQLQVFEGSPALLRTGLH